jgi:phosphate transport system permease protein
VSVPGGQANQDRAAAAAGLERVGAGRGGRGDQVFRGLARGSGLLVLVVLAGIAISMTQRAWPAFSSAGLDYFTSTRWDPNTGHFGILSFVYGTVVISAIALLIAVPVSIGIALFVTEIAHRRVARVVNTTMDVLAAVPSVVFGLWGFLTLRPLLQDLYTSIAGGVSGIPVLRSLFGSSTGSSFMTAGLILSVMIIPIITSISREVLRTVPANDRNGALALGATRWEAIRGVVLPHSTGGLVGASMLGLGRAMGETILVALVIGASPQIVANLFAQGEAMPSVIARNLNESSGTYQAALIGLGVCLFVLTILVNMAARKTVRTFERRMRGAA